MALLSVFPVRVHWERPLVKSANFGKISQLEYYQFARTGIDRPFF